MMMKLIYQAAVLCCTFLLTTTTWLNNMDAAKQQARQEHKFILLNFSGSDWCIPCMKLENDIFKNEMFMQYAGNHLVLVNADFPMKNKDKLSKEQQKMNDALAAIYNPDGNFPFTLLLDSNGHKIKIWNGYYKDGPENFVNEIKAVTENK